MTIRPSSRYAEGEVAWVSTKRRGNVQTVYLNTVTVLTTQYTAAIVRDGDNMAQYAYRAYRDPERWWVIADANPQAFYPLDLIPGMPLRIPT